MTITPRGESFLPNISMDELKNLYQKEGDSKAKIRLLAAILRKEGKTLEEISSTVKWSEPQKVYNQLRNFPI